MAEVHGDTSWRGVRDGDGFRREVDHASTPDLFRRLSDELKLLMRDEMAEARRELRESGRHLKTGASALGVGAYLAAIGGIGLMLCAIAAIATALPWWAAALIVGGALVMLGAILAAAGGAALKQAKPERTLSNLKEDERWLMSTLRELPERRRESTSA